MTYRLKNKCLLHPGMPPQGKEIKDEDGEIQQSDESIMLSKEATLECSKNYEEKLELVNKSSSWDIKKMCVMCGKEYTERQNAGRWDCRIHFGTILTKTDIFKKRDEYHTTCCNILFEKFYHLVEKNNRSYCYPGNFDGCITTDHRDQLISYTRSDDLIIPIDFAKELGILNLPSIFIDARIFGQQKLRLRRFDYGLIRYLISRSGSNIDKGIDIATETQQTKFNTFEDYLERDAQNLHSKSNSISDYSKRKYSEMTQKEVKKELIFKLTKRKENL
jgi:hypothetical protein